MKSQVVGKFILLCLLLSIPSHTYAIFGIKKGHKDATKNHNDSVASSFINTSYQGRYSENPRIDSMLIFAYSHLDKPYRSGSKGPNSFDCSGFTGYVFDHAGYPLQSCSSAQVANGVEVSRSELEPGDLVFFKGRNSRASRIGHVGIVLKVNSTQSFDFIHSASSSGISISQSTEAYYAKRFVTARRVIQDDYISKKPEVVLSDLSNYSSSKNLVDPPKSYEPSIKKLRVKKGQSLYSIAKQYKCTVSDLKKWNQLSDTNLQVGQKLYVYLRNAPKDFPKVREIDLADTLLSVPDEVVKMDTIKHIVKAGENLFMLAKQYKCSVSELKDLNKLAASSTISEGQKLLIIQKKSGVEAEQLFHKVAKGENLYFIAAKYKTTVEKLIELNQLKSTAIQVGQELQVK